MTIPDPLKFDHFDHETIQNQQTENKSLTQIQEFYKNTNIFVTGGTGFLGKILLEKLLRSCNEVNSIYVLVRNKKGKNVTTRVEEIFEDVVFDKMKVECPKFMHKIVAVAGDCSLPDIGLSIQDRKTLMEEINIVFHAAATVRFDEKMKTAVAINVRATEELLNLAHQMPKLKSFIHVSTAFANCPEKVIKEKFYPPALDYKKLLVMTETLSDKMMDNLTPIMLDKYPNTYAYTKQIAEGVVQEVGEGLPLGVVRPAIVVATYREPVRAWINNMYGPTGIVAGAGVGLIRVVHCDEYANANIVPGDMCVNSIIASAWDVSEQFLEAKHQNKNYEIPIYNFESSNDSPINWNIFMNSTIKYGVHTPSIRAVWYLCLLLEKNYFLYLLYAFLLHTVPAFLIDCVLLCIGKKPKMLKAYRKIHKFSSVLSYFSTQSWTFHSENVQKVCKKMSKKDNEIFFSDLKLLNWNSYFQYCIIGIRTFLLNDSWDTLPEAIAKWRRLYWIHQTVKVVLGVVLLRLLWTVGSALFTLCF
ncbi:unnamed protein product [Diabrotica balteata]|uniref:Fatty acyl-CoA reductase n=1 Tax=Diabrotica balteata TaxID=107213 RepID=A0A9P0DZH1_DIABA|nr:unnamed protein product [Diabrotica balteata]